MSQIKRFFVAAMLLLMMLPSAKSEGAPAPQAAQAEIKGVPWAGSHGVTEFVSDIMARESRLAAAGVSATVRTTPRLIPPRGEAKQNPLSPAVSVWPNTAVSRSLALPPALPQTVGGSFLGAQLSESGFIPPDSMGAVGLTQFLVGINGRIKVFSKAGVLGGLNTTTNNFFASVRGTASTSDPRVRFDRLSGRWFVTMLTVESPNKILLAVSSGSTITNMSSFTFFKFQQDQVGPKPNADTGFLADYDTLGVDKNALYIGVNIFTGLTGSFSNSTAFVVRKSSLTSGGPIVVTAFRGLISSAGNGPVTPQGVDNNDPVATAGYFIGVDNNFFGKLDLRRVSNPGTTPTLSGNLPVTVPTTRFPINVAAKGSAHPLDALDDRLFAAEIHVNKFTGVRVLCTAHNIQVNSTGAASTTGGRDGSRWYQIGTLSTTPSLLQSGTLFDSAATSPRSFWIPSSALSGQGHMVLASSVAGKNEFAEIAASGRLFSDAAGTLGAPTTAKTSANSYNVQNTTQRWGDYSYVSVDPNDDMTMWTIQEYTNAMNSWGVQVIKLRAPLPATPSAASPTSVARGATNVNVVITGTSSGGSAFFDPGTGYPKHIAALVNGGGVTVNSTTFTNATHITINVTVSPTAATGARTVTVINPDAQSRVSITSILTIT